MAAPPAAQGFPQGLQPYPQNNEIGVRNREAGHMRCRRAPRPPGHSGRRCRQLNQGVSRAPAPTGRGGYKSSRRSSQVSAGHLEAPPNTSTLLSTQGMTLPGMLVEQLAMLTISWARRTRSHMLNWLSSPTNACVASNLPPMVSCGGDRTTSELLKG